jgi:hypothetical protein
MFGHTNDYLPTKLLIMIIATSSGSGPALHRAFDPREHSTSAAGSAWSSYRPAAAMLWQVPLFCATLIARRLGWRLR